MKRRIKEMHRGSGTSVSNDLDVKGPEYIRMGKECLVGPRCRIEAWDEYAGEKFLPRIALGDRVRIHSACHIGAINSIEIGDGTLLGSEVFITDHSHGHVTYEESETEPTLRPLYSKGPVKIGKNVWIGERAVVLPGVTVGDCAVIGAMSVVTHDVPAYSVAAGNPARVVRMLK